MQYTGFFKRIIPFVLTFAVGLFVASFFVTIALPSFSNWREARRTRDCHGKQQLRREMETLRDELREVKRENEALKRQTTEDAYWENAVPPVVLEAPHPPTPPRKPKHPRFDNLK